MKPNYVVPFMNVLINSKFACLILNTYNWNREKLSVNQSLIFW